MTDINPSNTDAVLGGQNPPPVDAAILGGEIGRKQHLQHEKAIARANKFWQNFEYLDGLPDRHANIFADRQVVNFEPGMEIVKNITRFKSKTKQQHAAYQKIPEIRSYPGIDEILKTLATRKIPVAIVTSSRQPFCDRLITHLEWSIDVLVTHQDVRFPKPLNN